MAVSAEKINTILIAPLDWGLGHATRCIPIIRMFLQKGCRVIVAASGFHTILLQQEFPHIEFIHLDGYGIQYGKKNILLKLFMQLPRFYKCIKKENKWLEQIIEQYKIDGIISDNRYGLYSGKVPCVFITHQLQLKSPSAFQWTESMIRKRLYKFINRFSECWVPDVADENNCLAGSLSHPKKLPLIPVRYIGWLSKFEKSDIIEKKYIITICLSGPEPQRTLLENILLPQLQDIKGNILFIRGLPGELSLPIVATHVQVVNHLSTEDMRTAFLQSQFVISRSGYSTLMDMQILQCKCIFIPTPGQTEQEYLGEILSEKKRAIVKKQQGFNLLETLQEAASFPFSFFHTYSNSLIEEIITQWVKQTIK